MHSLGNSFRFLYDFEKSNIVAFFEFSKEGEGLEQYGNQRTAETRKAVWDAMKRKDGAAAGRLTAEECIVVGPQGVSAINRPMMSNLTSEGQWTLQDFELDEKSVQVRMLADDVASVAYKVTERLRVEGQELSLEANDASVWVRENGEWKCAIHTETLAGDPFGRDRRA